MPLAKAFAIPGETDAERIQFPQNLDRMRRSVVSQSTIAEPVALAHDIVEMNSR